MGMEDWKGVCNYHHCAGGAGLSATPGICFANVCCFFPRTSSALMQVGVICCERPYPILAFSVLLCFHHVTQLPPISLSLSLSPPLSPSVCVRGANGIITTLSVLDKHQPPPIMALSPPSNSGLLPSFVLFSNLVCFYNGAVLHPPHPHPALTSVLPLTHPFC